MFIDLNDIIQAENRLARFTKMIDLTNFYWDIDRPASELQDMVDTACHVFNTLIDELKQARFTLEDEYLQAHFAERKCGSKRISEKESVI